MDGTTYFSSWAGLLSVTSKFGALSPDQFDFLLMIIDGAAGKVPQEFTIAQQDGRIVFDTVDLYHV
jgi:hypothetical protein